MATHSSFSNQSAPSVPQAVIRNLVDVASKMARTHDLPLRVELSDKPAATYSHFTRWKNLSVEQKAKILDLIIDSYESNLFDPETDVAASTDPAFIKSSHLRKISSDFSSQIVEGSILLREKSEDSLYFYFTLDIDKMSAFSNNSRELAKYIEYRVPYFYRTDAALHANCKLFANAIAATVLERANLTPFRRNYGGTFKTLYQPFVLDPQAELPHEIDPVRVTRGPIEYFESDASNQHEHLPLQNAQTAPNTPARSQRSPALNSLPPIWMDESEIDFSSEEVQRALDEAEARAGARPWRPQNVLSSITEDSGSSVGTSDISASSVVTDSDRSTESYHHVPYPAANHVPPIQGSQGATFPRVQSPPVRSSSSVDSANQQGSHALGYIVPTRFMLISPPRARESASRRGRDRGFPNTNAANSGGPSGSAGVSYSEPTLSPFGHQTNLSHDNTPTRGGRGSRRGNHRDGAT